MALTWKEREATLDVLKGKTCTSVDRIDGSGGDEIHFTCDDGTSYRMYHSQDCCEYVRIEDMEGSLSDLVGNPLLVVEESSNHEDIDYQSQTWTFYKFATIKGHVDIRWLGESNGYYSESVDFERIA